LKEKILKWALVFLLGALMVVIGLFLKKTYLQKKYNDTHETFIGTGDSMLPTFSDGDELVVDSTLEPKAEDIIIFECARCNIPENELRILTKRLKKIDQNGCYWVEGDNQENSYDSRRPELGWLCSQDIKLFGVVVSVRSKSF
jgi:signal peptidase I